MLRTGRGTRRNREESLIWYRRSAEQGFTAAQCNLGMALFKGWGTRADPQATIDWWLMQASETGYVGADDVLATLRKVMTATQIARAQKLSADDATAFIRRPSPPVLTQQETPK